MWNTDFFVKLFPQNLEAFFCHLLAFHPASEKADVAFSDSVGYVFF